MENAKTPARHIENLWLEDKLSKKFTIEDILESAEAIGCTFEKSSIRKALSRAKYIAKPKKIKGNIIYSQKHPPESNLVNSTDSLHNVIFNKLHLHKEIKSVSSKLFFDKHYDQAVFAAFKKINNIVKMKSKQSSKDGKDLMLTTFTPNSPILKLNKMATQSAKDEQEGFMHIFAGTMQGIRNPGGHDDEKGGDPWETIELLCLASMLVKKLDKSRLNKNTKKVKSVKIK